MEIIVLIIFKEEINQLEIGGDKLALTHEISQKLERDNLFLSPFTFQ